MRIKVRSNFRSLAKDGREHQGLSADTEFFVLGVYPDDYSLIDLQGEPIWYPKELFEVLDTSIPSGWRFSEYEEGDYYLQPKSCSEVGFYEDWHGSDGDRVAQATARQTLRDELNRLASEADAVDRTLINEALARMPSGLESPSR